MTEHDPARHWRPKHTAAAVGGLAAVAGVSIGVRYAWEYVRAPAKTIQTDDPEFTEDDVPLTPYEVGRHVLGNLEAVTAPTRLTFAAHVLQAGCITRWQLLDRLFDLGTYTLFPEGNFAPIMHELTREHQPEAALVHVVKKSECSGSGELGVAHFEPTALFKDIVKSGDAGDAFMAVLAGVEEAYGTSGNLQN